MRINYYIKEYSSRFRAWFFYLSPFKLWTRTTKLERAVSELQVKLRDAQSLPEISERLGRLEERLSRLEIMVSNNVVERKKTE